MKNKKFAAFIVVFIIVSTLLIINHAVSPKKMLVSNAMNDNIEKVKEILNEHKKGVPRDFLGQALWYATSNNNFDMVKILVEHGADINYLKKEYPNKVLNPCLVVASRLKPENGDIIQFLLENGADINIRDIGEFGDTPLIAALYSDSIQTVKILLQNNPELKIKDKKGKTAIDVAEQKLKMPSTPEFMTETLNSLIKNAEKNLNNKNDK